MSRPELNDVDVESEDMRPHSGRYNDPKPLFAPNELGPFIDSLPNIKPKGRAYLELALTSEPSAKVHGNGSNMAGGYGSRRQGRTIQVGSRHYALPRVIMLEHDPAKPLYLDEPPEIEIVRRNISGRETRTTKRPDYLVIINGRVVLEETKPSSALATLALKYPGIHFSEKEKRWHDTDVEPSVHELGFEYDIWTEQRYPPALAANLTFLADYLFRDIQLRSIDLEIIAAVAAKRWLLVSDVLDMFRGYADNLYSLISFEHLYVDLQNDLISESSKTYVYRDRFTAEAHRLLRMAPETRQPPAILDLQVGNYLVWDSVPHKVQNVGADSIWLQTADGSQLRVSQANFKELVSIGAVKAASIAMPEPLPVQALLEILAEIPDNKYDEYMRRAVANWQAVWPYLVRRKPPPRKTMRPLADVYRRCRKEEREKGHAFIGAIPREFRRGDTSERKPPGYWEALDALIDAHINQPSQPLINKVASKISEAMQAKGYTPVSENQVTRRWRAIDNEARIRNREGKKKARAKRAPYDYAISAAAQHGDRPFGWSHYDSTEVSLFLGDEESNELLGKAYVGILLDGYSRKTLSTAYDFFGGGRLLSLAVLEECMNRHRRLPDVVIPDWGPESNNEDFESVVPIFLGTVLRRPKGEPQHGAEEERLMKRYHQDAIYQLRGNSKALQNPRGITKNVDPRNLAIWTYRMLLEAGADWENTYNTSFHEGINGVPEERFQLGLQLYGARSFRQYDNIEALRPFFYPSVKGVTRTVYPSRRIQVGYLKYGCPEFLHLVGQDVSVRECRYDISTKFARTSGVWRNCLSEFSREFAGMSVLEMQIRSAALIRQYGRLPSNRHDRLQQLLKLYNRNMLREQERIALLKERNMRHALCRSVARSSEEVGSGLSWHLDESQVRTIATK